MYNVKNMKWW